MKRLLFVLALAVTLLWNAAPVLAVWTTCGPWQTIIMPDGSIMKCHTCCTNGHCITNCIDM